MRRFHPALPPMLVLALLVPPSTALAAWPHVPSVNLPVCSLPASNPQFHTAVSDGAGGTIVTWQDQRAGANDIYAQHVLASGSVDPAWPVNGRAVCAAANAQYGPVIVSDGAGGALVAWYDYRNAGSADVYAQHVLASGVVDPAWPVDGRALCTATSEQVTVALAPDGAGGAIAAWDDQRTGAHDVYAQHLLASGAVDPAWPVDGRAVCTAAGDQTVPSLVSDGAGGAVLSWQDARTGTADIYAHHVRAGGSMDPSWPVNGAAVCTATNVQQSPLLVADGSGGAIVCWIDLRPGGNFDIYAAHVLPAGYVDGLWPADGRALCVATGNQVAPAIVADGAGGAFVAWDDRRSPANPDIYATHVLHTGVVDPAWPVDGRAVCAASGQQSSPAIASDGGTGVLVAWTDNRNGDSNTDVFATHVSAAGVPDPVWAANGNAVSTATSNQQSSSLVPDGAGGALSTWVDLRTGAFGIYTQRVARHGVLGTPEPVIAGVRDVPNDQGGKVKLSFDASWLDTDASAVVDHYWILRSVPAAAAAAALRTGATVASLAEAAGRAPLVPLALAPASAPRHLFATGATATIYWEFVASQQALHLVSGYSYLAATTGDSTGANNAPTQFMVTAWNAAGTQYWSSAPAGGYSVDNLPPYTPLSLIGTYGPGSTALHWAPNSDADFAYYRVYRGSSADFVPGPGNLVSSPPDTGFADAANGFHYKLSAVDTHGNESGYAALAASSTDDVPGGPAVALALRAPSPNPSADGVLLRLALPHADRVRLAIHDAAGRRVRRLLDGVLEPGELAIRWDGRGDAGQRLAPGLYFVRLESAGRVLTQRIARVE